MTTLDEIKQERNELRQVRAELEKTISEGFRASVQLELQIRQLQASLEENNSIEPEPTQLSRYQQFKQWLSGRS
jgi:hypothetical protein